MNNRFPEFQLAFVGPVDPNILFFTTLHNFKLHYRKLHNHKINFKLLI